jgi:peptidoglycan/xylan/chitin deacetylase (PgdA/CDA1 family)
MIAWWFIGPFLTVLTAFLVRYHLWRPNRTGVPVLMYHYLAENPGRAKLAKLWVRPSRFRRQMAWLARSGFRTVTLIDLAEARQLGRPLPERPVVVSFDDAHADSILQAADIMDEFGLKGVVFVPTRQAGRTNQWDRDKGEVEIKIMDWGQLQALRSRGWDIGSHTRTHAELTGVDDQTLMDELAGSKNDIEQRLGCPAVGLAYPYGAADQRVQSAARQAGYRLAFTTRPGFNQADDDSMALKRIIVKRKDDLLDFALKMKKGRSTF